MNQEWIALAIVALAALHLIRGMVRSWIAPGLSQWFLNKGHVKWAMGLRRWSAGSGCGSGCKKC